MKLGAFSISLSVKDLDTSRKFYETLGFEKFGGEESMNYLIMRNDQATIGLFQGMFEGNILTFNPGWDRDARDLESFTDIREIQQTFRERGIEFATEADEDSTGPASFVILDPDGNTILVDQHR
jgi:catechol 2,3-dioxygenase-like lactoylglutathione lyase family enzyme